MPHDENERPSRWCLVGNVVSDHAFGEYKEHLTGSKHFRPGAKVYIAPAQWGDGGEHVIVIGVPRHSRHPIEIVMRSELITNYRIKRVYSSAILRRMNESLYHWWDGTDESREQIRQCIERFNEAPLS